MNLVELCKSKSVLLCTAESITAGALAAAIAKSPGASSVLIGSVVAYQDVIKSRLLGVSSQLIQAQTAVDAEVAAQMADGVRHKFAAAAGADVDSVIGISTTGVAGPELVGNQPAGTIFVAVASASGISVFPLQLQGDRTVITADTVSAALELLREHVEQF